MSPMCNNCSMALSRFPSSAAAPCTPCMSAVLGRGCKCLAASWHHTRPGGGLHRRAVWAALVGGEAAKARQLASWKTSAAVCGNPSSPSCEPKVAPYRAPSQVWGKFAYCSQGGSILPRGSSRCLWEPLVGRLQFLAVYLNESAEYLIEPRTVPAAPCYGAA